MVWYFGKKHIGLFLVAECCILVSYTISVILPLNLTKLTDKVLYGKQHYLLNDVIKSYIFLFLTATVFNLIYAYVWQTLKNRYIVEVKNTLFEKILYSKPKALSNMNSGDMVTRIDSDSDQFLHVVQRNLFHFINSFFLCAAIIYMVAKINGLIAAMLVIAAFLPILITKLFSRLTEKYSSENRIVAGKLTGRIYEIVNGIREIKLMNAQKWARNESMRPLEKMAKLGNKVRLVDFGVNKSTYLINLTTSILIYTVSIGFILKGNLTIGMFLAIIQYIALLHKKFNWMLRIYLDWFTRKVSIEKVTALLECEVETASGQSVDQINTIEFRNVTFGYEENRVLDNVSFQINRGEKVAITGASGAGKTTIINLLLRFYEPQSGQILINGIDITKIRCMDIRRIIGVVSQEIRLFDETVRNNLSFGGNCPEQEMWNALDQVKMEKDIENLPDGLDTKIGLGGYGLSGGQKQRLMIARMLLKKSDTVILDEATSAMDVKTEEEIRDKLFGEEGDVTMLIISHRLSAIRNCDKIVVIRDGQIENIGDHEELARQSETYQKMFIGERA